MRARVVAGVLLCALLAAACGGRVSQEQVLAEAAADGFGGSGLTGTAGTGRTAAGGTATGSGSGTAAAGSTGASGGGSGSGSASASGAGGGGDGGSDTTLPPGGNGGATDVGVTEDTIVLGNVSTLSGPVPGLFRGALVGAQAWAAMVNSQGGINGRMIEIRSGDDALDIGRNRAAHLELRDQVFGFLGSFSVTDEGAAAALEGTNIPDIGYPLSSSRYQLPTNYSAFPARPGWESGPSRWYAQQFGPEVLQNTAFFVSAIESARVVARRERTVIESEGFRVVYGREVQANEPNYTGDVIQMRSNGVRTFMWEGQADQIGNMIQTMADQGFSVDLMILGNTAYSRSFLDNFGDAAEGGYLDMTTSLYQGGDAATVPEIGLFQQWMATIDPDQDPDLFAIYAWANGRMLEQALREVGPNVTRDGVLAAIANIHQFDANGLIAPADPGGRNPTDCFLIARVLHGEFVRVHPDTGFDCTTGPYVELD